jgi:hypothetical protein
MEAALKFLSATTGDKWVDTIPHPTKGPAGEQDAANNLTKFQQLVTDILLSENLVVLTGLGTSLSVNVAGKPPLAPTMADLWQGAEAIGGASFAALKAQVNYKTPPNGDNIEVLLSQCYVSEMLKPSLDVKTFIEKTESLVVEKCRFVRKDTNLDVHSAFLRKIAKRSTRKPRVKLFTTNYDLCFETAASRIRFVVVDGFSHTQPQEFDGAHFNYDFVRRESDRDVPDYVPNVVHLYKLHGSVDWDVQDRQVVKVESATKPLIIYPRVTKFELSYDQPYLELMSRFQAALRLPNTGLLAIGFGFNDAHLAQPLMAAIASNIHLRAMIVDPTADTSKKTDIQTIEKLIANGDWRLTLAATTLQSFVPLVPDLVTDTEEEQHRKRMTAARP